MTRRLAVTVAIIGSAICLSATQLSSARDTAGKVKKVKRQLIKRIEAYAKRSGGRAIFPTDNWPCLVCHANFEDEPIAAAHLPHGITCVLCHGLCYEHRDDENNVTKPDILFGRAEIEPFCRKCHGQHQHPERVQAFQEQWEGKVGPSGREILHRPTCTDCHGVHVL